MRGRRQTGVATRRPQVGNSGALRPAWTIMLPPALRSSWSQWIFGGPTVTRVGGDDDIDDNQTGVIVTGAEFGATQGSGIVEIGDNEVYASAAKVAQTVTAWAGSSITITAELGAQTPGLKWLFVTTGAGAVSPGRPIRMHRAAAFTDFLSGNISAGGVDVTTARLTAPAGKTTSDFDAGRRIDDSATAPSITITAGDYTEHEWAIRATADAVTGQTYRFRVVRADGTLLNAYTVNPEWTIGSGGGNATVTPATIAVTTSVPNSTESVGAAPAVIAATTTVPAPTESVGAAPATVAVVTTVPASVESIGAAPATIAATTTVPGPAITIGAAPATIATTVTVPHSAESVGVAPSTIAVVTTLPTPTAGQTGGGDATATPAAIAAVAGLGQPAVSIGAAPATIAAVTTVPASAESIGAAPATIAALTSLPQPTESVGAAPATITAAVALPASTESVGAASATIAAVVALPTPTAGQSGGGGATAAPAVIAAVTALPQPAVSVGAAPATVAAVAAVPGPTVTIGAERSPATIAATVAVPASVESVGAAPSTITALVTVPTPAALIGANPTPATVTALVAVPSSTESVGAAPATIGLIVALPTPAAGDGTSPLTINVAHAARFATARHLAHCDAERHTIEVARARHVAHYGPELYAVTDIWRVAGARILTPTGQVFSRAGINAPVGVSWGAQVAQGIDAPWAFEGFPGGFPWEFDRLGAAVLSTPPPGFVVSRWKVYDPLAIDGSTLDLPDNYAGFNGTVTSHAAARGVTAPPDNWRFSHLRIMPWPNRDPNPGTPTPVEIYNSTNTKALEALDAGAIVTASFFPYGFNMRDTPMPADLIANPTMAVSGAWPIVIRDMIELLDMQIAAFKTTGITSPNPGPVERGQFWFELANEPWTHAPDADFFAMQRMQIRRIRASGATNIIVVPLGSYGQDLAGLAAGRYAQFATDLESEGLGHNLVWSWKAYGANMSGPGGTNAGGYVGQAGYDALVEQLDAVLNTGDPSGRRYPLITGEFGIPIPPATASGDYNAERDTTLHLVTNTYGQPLAERFPLNPVGWTNDGTTEVFYKICWGTANGSLTETNGDSMPWPKMAYASAAQRTAWLTPYGQGLWDVSHAIESKVWPPAPALQPPTSMAPRPIDIWTQTFQGTVQLSLPVGWKVGDYAIVSLTTMEVDGVPTVNDATLLANGWTSLLNHLVNEGGGNTLPRRLRLWGRRLTLADIDNLISIPITDPTPPFYPVTATLTVWPGVDPTTPLDVAIQVSGSPDDPNPTNPAAGPIVTDGAAVVLYTFQAGPPLTSITQPTGFELLGGAATDRANHHVAYRLDADQGSTVTPGSWTKTGPFVEFSESLQATVVLRPAPPATAAPAGLTLTPRHRATIRS